MKNFKWDWLENTWNEIYCFLKEPQFDDEEEDDDDGFQSASSSLSEDKSKSSLVPVDHFDHWSHALNQAENKYFTWEQRGRYSSFSNFSHSHFDLF